MIELTPEQRQAAEQGEPVRVVDPQTDDAYVVVKAEVFERMAGVLRLPVDEAVPEIPPGILRSMRAFWRDLPDLLKDRKSRGKWVAYRGGERLGVSHDKVTLMREIVRRGVPADAYYVTTVEPSEMPPWEPEEVEPLGAQHFDDRDLP